MANEIGPARSRRRKEKPSFFDKSDSSESLNIESSLSNQRPVALVFCGGKGTRMQPITLFMRKEMLPVGPQHRPLLYYVVEHLKRYGIRDIVFLGSSLRGDEVGNYFGNGSYFDIRATHIPDPPKCEGTGHALLWAIKRLGLKGRELLVYYGDVLNTVNLAELLKTHHNKGTIATIAVSNNYIIPKGLATITGGGMVKLFQERPRWEGPKKIAIGLVCFDSTRLVKACGGLPSSASELQMYRYKDIMGDIVRHLASQNEVAAYETDAYWRDVGTLKDYFDLQGEKTVFKQFFTPSSRTSSTSVKEWKQSVFLSYKISPQNQKIVEDLLVPCLCYAGYNVISGAKLQGRGSKPHPLERAQKCIDSCDVVIAIATPEGKDRMPSPWVMHEVTYADSKYKSILLFIESGTNVPEPWRQSFCWYSFNRANTAALIRDILGELSKLRPL